jgi:Domain of unknown function (DUF3846)
MKAYHIDVTAREIRVVDYDGLKDMQRLVGGYICLAATFDNGDVVFVDDEGFFKQQSGFFRIRGVDQPLAGNGVLVGEELNPNSPKTADPATSLEEATALVTFLSRTEAEAWAQENDSRPASQFTDLDTGETTVLTTYGQLFSEMPKPEEGSGS